jgi:Ran GTPase-activating protein (RanGAP) involved in mRNA processing and transport
MKREIPTITISCGKNDMFMNPPCNSIGNTTSSVNYTTWTANDSKYGPAIINLQKSLTTIPESTSYVRPDFVLYTPPVNSFLEEPKYILPTVNTPSQYTTGDNYVIQELTTNLNKWQNFSYIDFSSNQLGSDSCRVLNEVFRDAKLPNLLTLVLTNNQIGDSGTQYLVQSLIHHYNNNLTTLILANNNLTNNGVTPFADGFNQFNTTTFPNGTISGGQITKLKTLDLRGNDKVCFTGKLYFFKNIDKCKTKDTSILFDEFTIKTDNAHSLNWSNILLTDSHYYCLSSAFSLGWFSSFHTLNLSNNKMGNTGSQYLAQSLINHYCNNLTTLNLANNNLNNNGVTPFADGLSSGTITKLKYLDLRGNSKICFSGMLYFFKDIDKCKTKDTSILFDKFTINTGDIHSLGLNNKLLNDSHIPWITGAFNLKWLASIHNLNLGNNQIGNDGVKVIADSLVKGKFPHLKTLRLEGNKITDEGDNFIINAIKNIKQHIIVLTRDLKGDGKMIFGSKEEKIIEYKKILAKCSEQGINNQVIVVNKTSFDKAKNLGQVGASIVVGFSKCHWELETLTQWYAQDKILAKLPKIGKVLVNTFNADDILSCYVEAKKEAFTSPIGCQIIKDELCVMGETEFCE